MEIVIALVIIVAFVASLVYTLSTINDDWEYQGQPGFRQSIGKVIKFKIGFDKRFRLCSYPIIGFRGEKGEYYQLPYKRGMTVGLMNLTDGDAVKVFYNLEQPSDFYIE